VPGLVNLDFADVKSIMACRGNALMGTGRGTGPNRAVDAASQAVSSPLLEDVSIHGAEGVLVNITGGRDLTLHEVNEAAQVVTQAAGDDANVIFGAVIDPSLDGDLLITVVATGFGAHGTSARLVERMHRPQPLQVVGGTAAPAEVAAGGGGHAAGRGVARAGRVASRAAVGPLDAARGLARGADVPAAEHGLSRTDRSD
jgi:cell division protein FtsZ